MRNDAARGLRRQIYCRTCWIVLRIMLEEIEQGIPSISVLLMSPAQARSRGSRPAALRALLAIRLLHQKLPLFQGKYLAGITTKDVEDFKAFRANTLKPRSVNRELGLLRAMLSRACEWQYLRSNPAKGVKELKYQKRPPTYLTLGQLDTLLTVCRYQHLYTFVVLAAYTGMRRGEILCLRWEDVSFQRREIAIRQKTKSYLPRTVPMTDLVVQALKRHPRHITSDLVLSRDDGNPYNDITKGFYAALKEADLPRIRLHDLRHYAEFRIMPSSEV